MNILTGNKVIDAIGIISIGSLFVAAAAGVAWWSNRPDVNRPPQPTMVAVKAVPQAPVVKRVIPAAETAPMSGVIGAPAATTVDVSGVTAEDIAIVRANPGISEDCLGTLYGIRNYRVKLKEAYKEDESPRKIRDISERLIYYVAKFKAMDCGK